MRTTSRLSHNADQTGLFVVENTDTAPIQPNTLQARQQAGRRLEHELLKIRRSLDALQRAEFEGDVNACIEAIRAKIRLSDNQRIERIFYAVERSMASTLTEIAEDTRLDKAVVKEIVDNLMLSGELYMARRFVPGSDRPWHSIKSRRQHIPEATGEIFTNDAGSGHWKAITREAA